MMRFLGFQTVGLVVATCAAFVSTLGLSAPRGYAGTPDDFMQISQLFSQYDYTIDNGDGDGWAATFTSGGVFRDPSWCAIGHDALVGVVGRDARVGKDQAHHHVPAMGPIVYLDRNTATIHSTVMVVRETGFGKTGGILVTGTYDDRLNRVNGRWLFAYRWVHRPSEKPEIACAQAY